jgi:hypothetical protein
MRRWTIKTQIGFSRWIRSCPSARIRELKFASIEGIDFSGVQKSEWYKCYIILPCASNHPRTNESFMKKTLNRKKAASAESIAKRAGRGEDVSRYFTNTGRMAPPVQRVNVDFAQDMLRELDIAARELNVSRQAVIKIFVRQALNQHYLAQKARNVK